MRKHYLLVACCFLLMGKACDVDETDTDVAAAIAEVNETFRIDYKSLLADVGSRSFEMPRDKAFKLMRRTLRELGFQETNSESDYYLSVTAPAPKPLDDWEWERVVSADEPVIKQIASKHLGLKGRFVKLEPDGINIDGTITLIEKAGATNISITFRFREIKPQSPESILPRREYPPPTASRIGYEKIWLRFEQNSTREMQAQTSRLN